MNQDYRTFCKLYNDDLDSIVFIMISILVVALIAAPTAAAAELTNMTDQQLQQMHNNTKFYDILLQFGTILILVTIFVLIGLYIEMTIRDIIKKRRLKNKQKGET